MILFIDTSNFGKLHLALIGQTVKEFRAEVAFNENYKTNAFLQGFMKKAKVTPKDLTSVVVCSGPGSFTGIRVGVALAQALGFALDVPVHALPQKSVPADLTQLRTRRFPKTLTLHYGAKPNITKAKRKKRS